MSSFTPDTTYQALLVIQAMHLLHHRIAKRHISFVEGITAVALCLPPTDSVLAVIPGWMMMGAHVVLGIIQLLGSIFIERLSPTWK